MPYISTRNPKNSKTPPKTLLGFYDILLSGLARDGGLYVPTDWPNIPASTIRAMQGKSYTEIAGQIMSLFTEGEITPDEMTHLAQKSYADFTHAQIAPLVNWDEGIYGLELFHGPTIAFKDYAMQCLARLFDKALSRHGKKSVILGATSGDTGSAALDAFRGKEAVDIFILFPKGRVSPVQQKQMTSIMDEGAHALAIDGDFDDCQSLVKACFNDHAFRDEVNLSAINSINWARLMPQIIYYFTAALQLGAPDKPVAFCVPTGNFGNIFAGWVAMQMGLPVEKFIVASNRNDILTRFFTSGTMRRQPVEPSLSPSMDIQVSSNFERLLFELLDRDGQAVANLMAQFSREGFFAVPSHILDKARQIFSSFSLDDAGTKAMIQNHYRDHNYVLDPHSAVGLAAAQQARRDEIVARDTPIISLLCAHPAKFPEAIHTATGITPPLPPPLADLMARQDRHAHCENDVAALKTLIRSRRR